MDSANWIVILVLAVGVCSVEFATLAGESLAALPRHRRADQPDPLDWVRHRREHLQVSLLVLNTLGITLTAAVLGAYVFSTRPLSWGGVILTVLVIALLMLLSQTIARELAGREPERMLRLLVLPLRGADLLLWPFTLLLIPLSRLIRRITHQQSEAPEPDEEEQEVEAAVEDSGAEPADLEELERKMIRNIIDLELTVAREIMIPRMDIIATDAARSPEDVVDLIVQHGLSRIPIYEETIDNVVGVVYAKDLLRAMRNGPATDLRSLARPAYFIPETKKVDELLKEFLAQRVHIAIVVDEYGGTAGLVSLEDLLEEIVGDIEDEYDRTEQPIQPLSADTAVLDARVSIDELNELFDTEIESEDFATVGGLVYARLGKIPGPGDEVRVDGLTISVLSTVGRRIKKVRVVHHGETAEAEAETH